MFGTNHVDEYLSGPFIVKCPSGYKAISSGYDVHQLEGYSPGPPTLAINQQVHGDPQAWEFEVAPVDVDTILDSTTSELDVTCST